MAVHSREAVRDILFSVTSDDHLRSTPSGEEDGFPSKFTENVSAGDAKPCACRGIRRCGLCRHIYAGETHEPDSNQAALTEKTACKRLHYCYDCGRAVQMTASHISCLHSTGDGLYIDRMFIWENFVSLEEEAKLVNLINEKTWVDSQSGRRKQDYGPKVNFKRRKINLESFPGLPKFCEFILKRIYQLPELQSFQCVELCCLEYTSARGSCIDAHTDDAWLWGERLVTLNLLSSSSLILTPVNWSSNDGLIPSVTVDMPRRSLFMMMGDSRYTWKHAVDSEYIDKKRIAMTFRELSKEFLTGESSEIGAKLLKTASLFAEEVVKLK